MIGLELSKGLPSNVDAERFVLGSILLDETRFSDVAGELRDSDFTTEAHRRIYSRMLELRSRGATVDRITIAEELSRFGELESVGGLSYVISLDEGLPYISNIDAYIGIVREKSTLRKLCVLYQSAMNRSLMAEEPARLIIEESRQALMTVYDSSAGSDQAETAYEIVREAGGIDGFFSVTRGIPSPWQRVDFFTGGWQAGELILVGARPSMGKTAFALNLLWAAANGHGKSATFYSYEMDKKSIMRRLVSLLTGISYQNILQLHMTQDERTQCRAAVDQIEQSPIRIVQSSGKTVLALRSHAEKLKHRKELDIIAIDYIGLMRSSANTKNNRNQELGEVARELKRIAMDLQVPVVCLSQLNRAVESRPDKRPAMSDLRDSGEIEEHADLIGFIHRPSYYNRDDPSIQHIAEFIIAKQRNGDTPLIDLEFQRNSGRFCEADTR